MSLLDNVNIRQGTSSNFFFSRGNTLPLCTVPHGMNHWTIQTAEPEFENTFFFDPGTPVFHGFRLTHQPSPWIGDYASILITPQTGPCHAEAKCRSSFYDPAKSIFSPSELSLQSKRFGVQCQVIPSSRAAFLEFHFSEIGEKRLIFDGFRPGFTLEQCGESAVCGKTVNFTNGVPENFHMHFYAELSEVPKSVFLENHHAVIEFHSSAKHIKIRFSTSFLSHEQAILNGLELKSDSAQQRMHNQDVWEGYLKKITAEWPSEERKNTFYSCLYRTLLFPREFHEFDPAGTPWHYSPYDGKIHRGKLYTDNGFWDTHRTLYPLLALLDPELFGAMVEGFLAAVREGGWLPRWCSPGYRDCMTGTHADNVLADAILRGIKGFDYQEAFQAMLQDGENVPMPGSAVGRRALADYLKFHYVPADRHEHAAAETMDYCHSDAAIAAVAEHLGDPVTAKRYRERSLWYRNLFDHTLGVIRGKNADGTFIPFREFAWGSPYIEGGVWQCGFNIPHDPEGFISLIGGKKVMEERLNRMLELEPLSETGSYSCVIHEMTEMAANGFGQYAHSNQPSHGILWFYLLSDARARGCRMIRRVSEKLYTPDHFPGDEDNGEMSAWYIFSVLGLYPFCAGKPEYIASRPLAENITITLPEGVLTIRRCGKKANCRIQINGENFDPCHIPHSALTGGGILCFE